MTRTEWGQRALLAVLGIAVPAVAVLGGASPAGAVRVGVAVVLAVAVESAVRVVGSTPLDGPSLFAAVARGPEGSPDAPPPRLEGWQRAMQHGVGSVGGWHFRLRPALRDLADGLLDDRNGVRLDRDRDLASALLGDRAWGRLRPDVPDPDDRWAAGLAVEELEQIVRRIEELGWG